MVFAHIFGTLKDDFALLTSRTGAGLGLARWPGSLAAAGACWFVGRAGRRLGMSASVKIQ